ncbi:MAG: class I SAM-dependent methyltransferase [bacterium]|nr:class I SAM-dependent methyltransferase [bacterium]
MTVNVPRTAGVGDRTSYDILVCSSCHHSLKHASSQLSCTTCNRNYPIEIGSADFSRGIYYDAFDGPESLTEAHEEGLRNEVTGTRARIEDYYGPLLRSELGAMDLGRPPRVLDSGCGNGISVDMLSEAGFEAWGNDISALRKWQWRERGNRERLVVAPSQELPFPDNYFDAVISSGVLEHVGVEEHGGDSYSVRPLPNRNEARCEFLADLLRVLDPSGVLLLDFPNGAFPIDFWHGTKPGGARFHSIREGFLPTVSEVRAHLRTLGRFSVTPLSPHRRLKMRQVGQHWYGRLLRIPMTALLNLMGYRLFEPLAGSPLNPYLVLKVARL